MILPDVPTRGTLRRRVLTTGVVVSVVIVGGLVASLVINTRLRDQLSDATGTYVEDQRIATELTGAVMRQILLVSARPTRPFGGLGDEFQRAGDRVNDLIQQYLFRDLSPEERIQLELIKAEHQHLEVAASRGAELLAGPEAPSSEAAADLLEHASALQDALHDFLQMRQTGLESLRSGQNAAFNTLYLAGAAFSVLILVGSAYLGRFLQLRVAEPLAALTETARRIGEGDLGARVPTDHDREFAALALAFNQMAADLEVVREDLESRNSELARALETVRQAQAELIESEKLSAMGRMTAGLAHELNNPLASVLGYGELLSQRLSEEGGAAGRTLRAELVQPIVQEAGRARRLVQNFIQFARGSGDQLGPVSVRRALDVVVGLRGFAFRRAGLELAVGEVPDVRVVAERQRLQEVVLDIVSNAYDAMVPQGRGRLRIEGELAGDTLLLVFEDEGPGVESLDRVFEPFYTTKPVGEGPGLGLALVHRTMEDFGGGVRAENVAGGGARFVLSFAVTEAPAGAEEPARESDPDVPAPASAPTPPASPATSPSRDDPPRILVVEDEAVLRRLQERILGRLDAEVLQAGNVAEAWAILESRDVDLIVSDVKMPGETGLALYRRVEERRPDLAEKFLFVTGDIGDPSIARLSAERPRMFLHKPFEMDEYLERVADALQAGSRG